MTMFTGAQREADSPRGAPAAAAFTLALLHLSTAIMKMGRNCSVMSALVFSSASLVWSARGSDNKDVHFVLFFWQWLHRCSTNQNKTLEGKTRCSFDFSPDLNLTATSLDITFHLLTAAGDPSPRAVAESVQMRSDISIYNRQITAVMFNIPLIPHV